MLPEYAVNAEVAELAATCAEHAFREIHHLRRGLYPLPNETCECKRAAMFCLFDTNPFFQNNRDQEVLKLRQWMKAVGVTLLAHANFPSNGDHAGHTIAMIVAAESTGIPSAYERLDARWSPIVDRHVV